MKKTFATTILIIIASCFAVSAWASTPVKLRHRVEINSPAIRLADVFDGIPDDLDRDIATAPAPGKSVTYDFRVLGQLTDRYRLEWQPESTAEKSILTRAATVISADMIQEAILQKLKETMRQDNTSVEVIFDNRNLGIYLATGREPTFSLINFSYDEPNHRFRTELVAQTEGQPINQQITGRVIVKKTVPVLSHRLASGTSIGVGDLTFLTLNEDRIGIDVLTDASQIIGQELRHDQAESQLLRVHDVMPTRLVIRGSLITMKIQTPTMLITTQGKALQDGAKGDVVRVTNMQSSRVVEGTVEATGVVRVGPFAQMAAAR
ncbi:MAG: flagellar basal body P-ring formation chaperone FlgA [Alphaproteobacteria bacterium]|nr:flagellar basal body P-ring formation chaperone FlgA [Alphaproteobacteria bacterium]